MSITRAQFIAELRIARARGWDQDEAAADRYFGPSLATGRGITEYLSTLTHASSDYQVLTHNGMPLVITSDRGLWDLLTREADAQGVDFRADGCDDLYFYLIPSKETAS